MDDSSTILIVKNSDQIKVSHHQAQANYKMEKREVTDKNGTVRKKKIATVNDEKIADACVSMFQDSDVVKNINYYEIREEAIAELEPRFIKHNIVVNEKNTNEENLIIEKKRKIAINEMTERLIQKRINLNFNLQDFDAFINRTGIKSAKRIGNALEILMNVQNKGSYEWYTDSILDSEDFSEIVVKYVSVSPIPEISLSLSKEIKEKYNIQSIREFAKNPDIKQKRKHIKGLSFKINPTYATKILCIGTNYITRQLSLRHKFKTSYTYRLDSLLKSIYKVQYRKDINFFTFEDIQKKFGTDYKEYKSFKAKVLSLAIEEINEFAEYSVKLIEHRKGDNSKGAFKEDGSKRILKGALKGISFQISPKSYNDKNNNTFGIDSLAFYIASRMYFFDKKSKIKNLDAFAKSIENAISNTLPGFLIYLDKNIEEWKSEYEKMNKAREKLVQFIQDNTEFFEKEKIKYDHQMMTILKFDENEEKYKLVKYKDMYITNPLDSFEFINEYYMRYDHSVPDITDFFPFRFATSTGWKKIKDSDDFLEYESLIIEAIIKNKVSFFHFTDYDEETKNPLEEIFKSHVINKNFIQVKKYLSNLILDLKKDFK